MLKKLFLTIAGLCLVTVFYLVAWPVPIEPVAWQALPDPGYSGVFLHNERLKDLQDPDGTYYPMNTSVTETRDYLYIGSLIAPEMGRLSKQKIAFGP